MGQEPVEAAAEEGLESLLESFQSRLPELADRVMVFVDWAYVVRGVQGFQRGRSVNVARPALKLARRRRLIRTYIYDGRLGRPA